MCYRSLKRLLRNECGIVSVEAVIWIPFYALLIGVIADASALIFSRTEMWTVASDSARFVSMGTLTVAEAEAYAASRTAYGDSFVISISMDATTSTVTADIQLPFNAVNGLGILTNYPGNLGVSSTYRLESNI